MQPFGRNWYGPKIGGCAPLGRGANTMWPGPRPSCMPSFIFIRPTVWPQCTNVTDRQTDRQDRQRGQRIDSIGRTVLHMVAQKTKVLIIFYSAASGSIKQNLAICVTILKQHCNIYSKNSNTAILTILRKVSSAVWNLLNLILYKNSSGDETANVNFYAVRPELPEFAEITQNNGHYAVQGHSRSPILVPIESPYTISY